MCKRPALALLAHGPVLAHGSAMGQLCLPARPAAGQNLIQRSTCYGQIVAGRAGGNNWHKAGALRQRASDAMIGLAHGSAMCQLCLPARPAAGQNLIQRSTCYGQIVAGRAGGNNWHKAGALRQRAALRLQVV